MEKMSPHGSASAASKVNDALRAAARQQGGSNPSGSPGAETRASGGIHGRKAKAISAGDFFESDTGGMGRASGEWQTRNDSDGPELYGIELDF